ncbi:MAG: rRNA maturation RNase YbeY [Victivallaceae bacterium]|nr:rRNA maturation RNase YbeY [Victivallaceae bacterium]
MKTTSSWRDKRHCAPHLALLRRLTARAAQLAGLPSDGDWECDLCFLNDSAMAKANKEFVGHTGTTDVITFSYFDDPATLFPGETAVELLICTDVAAREGLLHPESGGYAGELVLYLVHGLLHAAGEDDLTDEARVSMRRREREVLSVLREEFDFAAIFG